jgi:deoxyribonuclease-1
MVLFLFLCHVNAATDWSLIHPPSNFLEAKHILMLLYQENPETFYCDCHFTAQGIIDRRGTSVPTNLSEDLLVLEWEHIVPASLLGHELECWSGAQCSYPGRSCCQKKSEQFQLREANLYNLVPSIRFANRYRSNFKPGLIKNKKNAVRVCHLWIDKKNKIIEPDDKLKGFIARTYLKLHELYHFKLSEHDRKLFKKWNVLFPADQWERRREEILNQIYSSSRVDCF